VTNSASAHSRFDTLPLLRQLPEPWRQRFTSGARPWRAEVGTIAFEVGAPCTDLTVLVSGTIRIVRPLTSGHEILLYRLQPGELCVITMSCLLANTVYPARGVVDGAAHGLVLPGPLVREAVVTCEPFRQQVFALQAQRLAGLMAVLEERVAHRLDSRLAALLVAQAPVLLATHQQMAGELASAREVVSRVLEGFEARGWVRLSRARVDVLDVAALARLAQATGT